MGIVGLVNRPPQSRPVCAGPHRYQQVQASHQVPSIAAPLRMRLRNPSEFLHVRISSPTSEQPPSSHGSQLTTLSPELPRGAAASRVSSPSCQTSEIFRIAARLVASMKGGGSAREHSMPRQRLMTTSRWAARPLDSDPAQERLGSNGCGHPVGRCGGPGTLAGGRDRSPATAGPPRVPI